MYTASINVCEKNEDLAIISSCSLVIDLEQAVM